MTLIFFRSMYSKTIIRFGFCDIQNNRDLGKGYQPSASADNPYLDLNNCLLATIKRFESLRFERELFVGANLVTTVCPPFHLVVHQGFIVLLMKFFIFFLCLTACHIERRS